MAEDEMWHNFNKKNDLYLIAVLTIIFTLAMMTATASIMVTAPAAATTTPPTTTSSEESGIIQQSPEPIYQKHTPPGNIISINQTHISATHNGNGTLTLPNSTTQTINFTITNGTAIVSLATSTAHIKETIRAENGEALTVTAYEIHQFNNPAAALQGGGKGIVTAILQTNSTGILAPLNGMILAGIDDFASDGDSRVTLWKWESGIPALSPALAANSTSGANATD